MCFEKELRKVLLPTSFFAFGQLVSEGETNSTQIPNTYMKPSSFASSENTFSLYILSLNAYNSKPKNYSMAFWYSAQLIYLN